VKIDLLAGVRDNVTLDERGRLRLVRDGAGHVSRGEFISSVVEAPATEVSVEWLEQWTAPQRFAKHPGNPVYGPAQSGDWDDWTNGVSIVPNREGRTYRMFYCGRRGGGIGFAEATLSDPLTWREHPSSPVFVPREDNWEGNLINQPRVVKVTDTHWRMYYTGWGAAGEGTNWALGLAESFDEGVTWQRYQDERIIERGDRDSPDGAAAVVPMVVRVGKQKSSHLNPLPVTEGAGAAWWMWYTGGQINPHGHQHIHLCLAFSDDGIHWRKYEHNPVLTDDFSDNAPRSVTSRCYVRHEHGVFQMWYSFAKPDYRIRYAESLDGIAWERSPIELALDASPAPAWDDQMVEYPEVQVVDGVWRLWFCGNGYGSVGYAEGILDTRVELYIRSGPTREPDEAWSGWVAVRRGRFLPVRQHVQVKAVLISANPALSPALNACRLVAQSGGDDARSTEG